jgi:exopolyphosphatase / guanosine-5'-triphosphate,3'-diphosphate pyrophosphatase
MPIFAAVDIGANSVRLKIASPHGRALKVIHEDREVTRLGESVFRSGVLSTDAMERTIKVLQRFHRAAQNEGADFVRVVATSSLRDAQNASAFIDWARSATGWEVEVISGVEEGRLIHLAVVAGAHIADSRALLLDLGGGSCELTLSDRGAIREIFSLPLGAVRLTQEFLQRDPPKRKDIERLRTFIDEEITRVEARIDAGRPQVAVATSGTAAALAGAFLHKRVPTGATVPTRAVRDLSQLLAKLGREERARIVGIGTRRAEIIVAGAVVFAQLLTRVGLSGFRYSPLGLRDGLLAQMTAQYDRNTRFHKQIEAQRRTALLELGKHYGIDMKFAETVRQLCADLFAGLKSVHQLPPEYEELLTAAAMLHEIGSFINRAGRHRHTYYIISHSEIFGYSTRERQIIGSIARYVGRSRPTPEARPMRPLDPATQKNVAKAIALLRLARALNQSRRNVVEHVTLRMRGGRALLEVVPKRGNADLEMWALEKETGYFREVFGRELAPALS